MNAIVHHAPPGTPYKERQALGKWCKHHGGGCWGIWQHARQFARENRARAARSNRKNRVSKYFPKGTPTVIQRRYYSFIYQIGRCSFKDWWAWQQGKAEHPISTYRKVEKSDRRKLARNSESLA